jgi:Protein of unknown function (DUF775)
MSFIGIAISGRPVITNLTQTGVGQFVVEIPNPSTISDVCIFLLPGISLPEGQGLGFYYKVGENVLTLGSLMNNAYSSFIKTDWPTNPHFRDLASIMLGISVQSIADLANITQKSQTEDISKKISFVQLVARDISNYLSSFSTIVPASLGGGERLVLPLDCIDKWLIKFEHKFRMNPLFLYTQQTGI